MGYRTIEAAVEKGADIGDLGRVVEEDVAYQLKAGYAKVISCKDLQNCGPSS
jgi:hypothetical protein